MRCVFDADAQYEMLASPRILTNVSLANRFSFTANLRLSLFVNFSNSNFYKALFQTMQASELGLPNDKKHHKTNCLLYFKASKMRFFDISLQSV